MRNVRQVLEAKSPEIYAIGPGAPMIDAIRLMAEQRVGALLVMNGESLVGIISERDYARKIILQGRSSSTTAVGEVMTADLRTVRMDDSAEHCMALVTDQRIRHLPVVEHGKVMGVVSIGDLVKAVIEDQQAELVHLQRYIES